MSPNLKTNILTLDLGANHRVGRPMSHHMWSNRSPRCPSGPSFCSGPPTVFLTLSIYPSVISLIIGNNICGQWLWGLRWRTESGNLLGVDVHVRGDVLFYEFAEYWYVSFMVDVSWTHSFAQECVMSRTVVASQSATVYETYWPAYCA